jgi:hypothetical protein
MGDVYMMGGKEDEGAAFAFALAICFLDTPPVGWLMTFLLLFHSAYIVICVFSHILPY